MPAPRPLRICLVESAPRGGLLQYAAQLGRGLAAQGHDVVLITARDNELLGRDVGVPMRASLVSAAPPPGAAPTGWRYALRRAGVALRLLRASARTFTELRRGHFDAVLLVDDLSIALAALCWLTIALLPGPPLTVICHEPRPRNRWEGRGVYTDSRLLTWALGRFYRRAAVVFVHGEASRRLFTEAWSAPRVAVIPHGDERLVADKLLAPSGEERILFFGDWRRAKGLAELRAAFDLVVERRPQARLTIAGTPSPDGDPEEVRRWARAHGERVTLVDRYVALDDVAPLFAAARVVALPYLAASQSGVLHLAMTVGRAVVASDVGELAQTVVDGTTGVLVPPGDVPALAAALERVLADADLATAMGAAGRERIADTASWSTVAGVLTDALRAALAAGQRTSS